MIKVLVVDDSPVVRELLKYILESDPEIRVVGQAGDGVEAVKAVKERKPDVVTMDVNMPNMDGFEATRVIMETSPVPIIIVTGVLDPREMANTFRTMEAGALAIVAKPSGTGHPDHDVDVKVLIRHVKAMSQVRLVRRWPRQATGETASRVSESAVKREQQEVRLVAIGASTGGPAAIQRILAALPRDFPAPVLVVQHMAKGFIAGFAGWLAQSSFISVKVAVHGEMALPGCALVAPDEFNMGVDREGRIELIRGDGGIGHCPSVAHLFRSVADVYGRTAVGILLTGMGKDGADELLRMKKRGALTIAQDQESCVVYGMPGVANDLNAANFILPPDSIAEMLKNIARNTGRVER